MAFTQTNRQLRVNTPLGADKLLIVELNGREGLSELFQYQLTLLAENSTKVEFDKLIGQPIIVEMDMPGKKKRFFNGICSRLAEGRRDDDFTHYRMEVVPQLWLLTRRVQSRIFQHMTVPDILKQVLKGLDIKWDIQGKFFERDYCVQYRESDFAFASRLMEEEGIYYYFTHSEKGHTLVVANTPQGHAELPEFATAIYEPIRGGNREEMRVTDWEKVQELRSGKVTLWDHCFELPQKNLEAQKIIQESVPVGKVVHKLKLADNDQLELYDFPGAYAQRFDGIDAGGGARPDDLKKIFEDNARVAKLHIEREAVESLVIRGASNCRPFGAGQKFTLERHFNGDGAYVLTGVDFTARLAADFRSGQSEPLSYENRFTCIPLELPFRPQLRTQKPTVGGTQTATVVGPPGELIFCDKYGRVKVQFHWDRHGKKDANSSCWVRASQNWGGSGWGGMFIPHVGQEVIIDFEEGDPDCPLIVGRVYNAESMPPLTLPANKTHSVIQDHGGNKIIMQGHGGVQQLLIHSPSAGTLLSLGAPSASDTPVLSGGGAGSGAGAGPKPTVADALAAAKKAKDDAEAAKKNAEAASKAASDSAAAAGQAQAAAGTAAGAASEATKFLAGFGLVTGGNWTEHVAGFESITVGETSWKWVKGNTTEFFDEHYALTVGKECHTLVKGEATHHYEKDLHLIIDGKKHEDIKGDHWYTFHGSSGKHIVGAEHKFVIGGTHTLISPFKFEEIGGASTAVLVGAELKIFKSARGEIGSNKKVTKFADFFGKVEGGLFHKGTWMKVENSASKQEKAKALRYVGDESAEIDAPDIKLDGTEHVTIITKQLNLTGSSSIKLKGSKADVLDGVLTISS